MVSLVTEELDPTEITASYLGEKGQSPFHPAMMVAGCSFAYCCGQEMTFRTRLFRSFSATCDCDYRDVDACYAQE